MGYVIMTSLCISCGRLFSYNPHHVPSVRIKGEREPVCRPCMDRANGERKRMGLPLLVIHPDAYDPIPEEEL